MNFAEDVMLPIIAILSAVALPIVLGSYLALIYMRGKNKENLEMIQQGMQPASRKSAPSRYRSLRNGILCLGVGLGIITGILLTNFVFNNNERSSFFVMASSILIFLGASYILFYFITKDKNLDEY